MMAATARTEDYIVCPRCDALHLASAPAEGFRAHCTRCGTVLITTRRDAVLRVFLLALTTVILMTGAVAFPFLQISLGSYTHGSSVVDAVLAFEKGGNLVMSVAVAALIVILPLTRMLLIVYALMPVAFARPAWRWAAQAFRWAENLRPWAMAEIFLIGVAVALVKVSGLAQVEFGPAFWFFAALVVILLLKDTFLCKWTIWDTLDRPR